MLPKIAAVVTAIAATILGIGAISIFRSGERGYLILVGLICGLGSVALFLLAARLYLRQPPSSPRQRTRVAFSGGQRLGLIALAVLALAFGAGAMVTGKAKLSKGPAVLREKQPSEFWQTVLFYFGTGGALLYLGLRRPPSGDKASRSKGKGGHGKSDA